MLRATRTRTALSWAAAALAMLLHLHAAAAPALGYDSQADPFEQYHDAIEVAERENKLVLIIAGGEWCRWCHVLDRFVRAEPEVDSRLHAAFVVLKVYVGFDNYNDAFFSQLPQAKGAPHFWIVSPKKEVLSSQSTGGFEAGKSTYDKQAFLQFIADWKAHAEGLGEKERVADSSTNDARRNPEFRR